MLHWGGQGKYSEFDGVSVSSYRLTGDGDFRSDECIEVLKQSDVVVTNPPFSLFRPFISQLIEYRKEFLVIGNMNAITYKEIFPLIKQNLVWFGPSIHSGDREFGVPDSYLLRTANFRIDENGKRYVRVSGVRWWTNLDYPKHHEPLLLHQSYYEDPSGYPKYDNYDAINVNSVKDIPYDYFGVMGVPISFMDKYNPDQFEIVGGENYSKSYDGTSWHAKVGGKNLFKRILIQRIVERKS